MQAITFERFGDADVLQVSDVDRPEPGPGELLVRVMATSINPVDYKIRDHGDQYGIQTPAIPGYDVSGVVEAVGDGIEAFEKGDEVFYTPQITPQGTYAEYHVTQADLVRPKPSPLTHEEAAALPLAGCTAWQALIDRALLEAGERVLIHGSGGVGLLALQIAKSAGAEVYVTASPAALDWVEEFGVDGLVSYKDDDALAQLAEQAGAPFEVVLDTVGGDTLERSLPHMGAFSRTVTIVGTTTGLPGRAMAANVTLHYLMMQRDGRTMDSIWRLAERGLLRPLIDEVRPLKDAADAQRRLEGGGVQGKIILRPDDVPA